MMGDACIAELRKWNIDMDVYRIEIERTRF